MTTKILTGTYTAGYTLQSPITTLRIAASGYVEGVGVATSATATASYAVVNFGRIVSTSVKSYGVYLAAGGSVTNGGAADAGALIEGHGGVFIGGGGTVTNHGTIDSLSPSANDFGVDLGGGSTVINGAGNDRTALIEAGNAIYISGLGTIENFGTILATAQDYGAVNLSAGTVINGDSGDRTALIEGSTGVNFRRGRGTIINAGTIDCRANAGGVFLDQGGVVLNGASDNHSARIEGYYGMELLGGSATNFGVIVGDYAEGVVLQTGASITNGAAGYTGAAINGYRGGVYAGSGDTVTNFGTIRGGRGAAIRLESASDVLVVEAGSIFKGAVLGGGGTLDLASGVGTLTGLLSSGGDLTVSGSMATTTFSDFATVEVGPGAQFTDTGAVTLAAGQTVNSAEILTLGGAGAASIVNAGLIEVTAGGVGMIASVIRNSGTLEADGGVLTVSGAVTGAGKVLVDRGTLDFAATFNQTVIFSGTGSVLELAQSQAYAGTLRGFSKTGGSTLDLVDIGFVSAGEATYSGTTTGGTLTVTDGTHTAALTLQGDYLGSTFTASSDGHGGTNVVDPTTPSTAMPVVSQAPAHQFIAAMAGLGVAGGAAIHASHALPGREPMLATPRP